MIWLDSFVKDDVLNIQGADMRAVNCQVSPELPMYLVGLLLMLIVQFEHDLIDHCLCAPPTKPLRALDKLEYFSIPHLTPGSQPHLERLNTLTYGR